MTVNPFKQLSNGRDCEFFFADVPQVGTFHEYVSLLVTRDEERVLRGS